MTQFHNFPRCESSFQWHYLVYSCCIFFSSSITAPLIFSLLPRTVCASSWRPCLITAPHRGVIGSLQVNSTICRRSPSTWWGRSRRSSRRRRSWPSPRRRPTSSPRPARTARPGHASVRPGHASARPAVTRAVDSYTGRAGFARRSRIMCYRVDCVYFCETVLATRPINKISIKSESHIRWVFDITAYSEAGSCVGFFWSD